MQIITGNIAHIVHGDQEKVLAWQLGQMLTTCENWLDRLCGQGIGEGTLEGSNTFPRCDPWPNSQSNAGHGN